MFKSLKRQFLGFVNQSPIRAWLIFYALSLSAFELTRFILLMNEYIRGNLVMIKAPMKWIFFSFFVGLRFDLAVTGYVAALPLLITFIIYIILPKGGFYLLYQRSMFYIAYLLFSIAILINFVDLEFWNYYSQRLNAAILNWVDTPSLSIMMVFEMFPIIRQSLVFIILILASGFVLKKRIINTIRSFHEKGNIQPISFLSRLSFSLLTFILVFLSIRGRIEAKSPLTTGHSFFCDNTFANQLALNSVFSLGSSISQEGKRKRKRVPESQIDSAFHIVQRLIFRDKGLGQKKSIDRLQTSIFPQQVKKRLNVILIITESLTAQGIRSIGVKKGLYLSPHLDKIISQSLTFSRFYANNVHTGHGLFNLISSFPNPEGISLTKTSLGERKRQTWPRILKRRGYSTIFFTTHDPHFDNIHGYVKASGFEKVISESDYRVSKASTLGVFDHKMFDEALRHFEKYYKQKKPFAAVLLTATNHGPWLLPKEFPLKSAPSGYHQKRQNTYMYTDWAIGRFFQALKKAPYYKDTIIIITADHGYLVLNDAPYPGFPYPFIHIPLIIHSNSHPGINNGKIVRTLGSQIDVGPTLLDLLGISYNNQMLGTSLVQDLQSKRFVSFIYHNIKGWISGDRMSVFSPSRGGTIFKVPEYQGWIEGKWQLANRQHRLIQMYKKLFRGKDTFSPKIGNPFPLLQFPLKLIKVGTGKKASLGYKIAIGSPFQSLPSLMDILFLEKDQYYIANQEYRERVQLSFPAYFFVWNNGKLGINHLLIDTMEPEIVLNTTIIRERNDIKKNQKNKKQLDLTLNHIKSLYTVSQYLLKK